MCVSEKERACPSLEHIVRLIHELLHHDKHLLYTQCMCAKHTGTELGHRGATQGAATNFNMSSQMSLPWACRAC